MILINPLVNCLNFYTHCIVWQEQHLIHLSTCPLETISSSVTNIIAIFPNVHIIITTYGKLFYKLYTCEKDSTLPIRVKEGYFTILN